MISAGLPRSFQTNAVFLVSRMNGFYDMLPKATYGYNIASWLQRKAAHALRFSVRISPTTRPASGQGMA